MAFNAKNLTYDANEPEFLRKLRSQHEGRDSARSERPLARPRKQLKDEEEDEPTYVVDSSQDTMLKAEYDELLKSHNVIQEVSTPSADAHAYSTTMKSHKPLEDATSVTNHEMTAIGASKKRRSARIVGGDREEAAQDATITESAGRTKNIKAKKSKKVKLSFDEEA